MDLVAWRTTLILVVIALSAIIAVALIVNNFNAQIARTDAETKRILTRNANVFLREQQRRQRYYY